MFLSEWREFPSAPCLRRKETWWELASRCCWNRARPWYACELFSFLVGLRTYQHPRTRSLNKTQIIINKKMWSNTSLRICDIQSDQKVCVHLMITIQKSGAQRLFSHPVEISSVIIPSGWLYRSNIWWVIAGKVEAIPVQAWGFQEVEAPRFQDNRHMKVVRLSALRTGRLYLPRKYSWYSFLSEAESTPGTLCGWKDYVNDKFQFFFKLMVPCIVIQCE